MTEQLTRGRIEVWRDMLLKTFCGSAEPEKFRNDAEIRALCDMALTQAEQTKAAPSEGLVEREYVTKALEARQNASDEARRIEEDGVFVDSAQTIKNALLLLDSAVIKLEREAALALRRDAEDAARYRWLRTRINGDTWLEHNLGDIVNYELGPDAMISGSMLDAAIDAARRDSEEA